MTVRAFLPFQPEKILATGLAIIGGGLVLACCFLVPIFNKDPLIESSIQKKKKTVADAIEPLSISLNLRENRIALPLPRVEQEIFFSFDPPLPGREGPHSDLFVRLKRSVQSKRVTLPTRLDLQYVPGDILEFSETPSLFWLEIGRVTDDKILGVVWVETPEKGKMEAERFCVHAQMGPIQGALEFPEASPFRILGEAKWSGPIVFYEKGRCKQQLHRIEVGGHALEIGEGDWLFWAQGRWIKGTLEDSLLPAARIESFDGKTLIFEGWDNQLHVRMACALNSHQPFKIKSDEIFNSIRIRSEKQISCMMEKQCLILRAGDWVLKSEGRWKILRKEEERESLRLGKITGELFIFEKIETKQGQKHILGQLFNVEKTQFMTVNLPVNKHSSRKAKIDAQLKAKGHSK